MINLFIRHLFHYIHFYECRRYCISQNLEPHPVTVQLPWNHIPENICLPVGLLTNTFCTIKFVKTLEDAN